MSWLYVLEICDNTLQIDVIRHTVHLHMKLHLYHVINKRAHTHIRYSSMSSPKTAYNLTVVEWKVPKYSICKHQRVNHIHCCCVTNATSIENYYCKMKLLWRCYACQQWRDFSQFRQRRVKLFLTMYSRKYAFFSSFRAISLIP